jgi:hypothetical protein
VTAYDQKMFWRTLVMTGLLLGVTVAVVGVTDEPGSTTRMRLARICAIVPGLASLAGVTVLEQARYRGEIRALSALGTSPWDAARGVARAGYCVGLVAAFAMASGLADTSSLFPALREPAAWQVHGDQLVESVQGVSIRPDGMISLDPASSPRDLGRAPSHWVAALAIALVGGAMPSWTATPMSLQARVFGFLLAAITLITVFHVLAIGLMGPPWLVLIALPLGLQALCARFTTKPDRDHRLAARSSARNPQDFAAWLAPVRRKKE